MVALRIIVAHPNAQHSHRLALAVQKADWLEAYVTQLYYDRRRWPYNLVSILSRNQQQKVDDALYRRKLDGLDPNKVITYDLWAEIFFIILNRLGIARRFREHWLINRSRVFSRRVGKLALKSADLIIGTDSASFDAFRIAKSNGIISVLDLSHPHINTCIRIEDQERKLEPDFACSFDTYAINVDDLDYLNNEIRIADAIIVASTFSKESLIENGVEESRIHIIPYGVDLNRFHPSDERNEINNDFRVLFVGRIGQRKGISYLLKSIHDLRSIIDIRTTLVGNLRGDNQIYDKYRGEFTHHNRLPDSIYPEIYHSADVFVLPSLVEGFGLVLLEAMASGLPVITTTNTGGRDIITDGKDGFIVPVRDIEAIKHRLLYLYHHPEEKRQMGYAARLTAERYPWEHYYSGIKTALKFIHEDSSVISEPI